MQNNLETLDHALKNFIPSRPDGKPIHRATLWRWIRKGLEGLDGERIKLEVTYAGSRPYVTRNAVEEFFQAVTEAKLERHRRAERLASEVTQDKLEAVGLR
ncbi:MAG: hypothetical protein MK102_18915 [Fuerstiella sp.]|nr:hypothetical protein [Fuerstiella sp.]